jgi:DNA (cytosine-5)-methyltransferase 1
VSARLDSQVHPAVAPPASAHCNEPNGTSVELFAGGGGLALGVEQAGFQHLLVSELDERACETLRHNKAADVLGSLDHVELVRKTAQGQWPLISGRSQDIDYRRLNGRVDLLAGGPPCQPFSLGGVHRGDADERDLFPEAARALKEIHPRAFFFENVRGLARPSFAPYFEYIGERLKAPHVARREGETWTEHQSRLRQCGDTEPATHRYNVFSAVVNAADYGVPQIRWRVLFVGFRADLEIDWTFPLATHSKDALLYDQIKGDYFAEHGIKRADVDVPVARLKSFIREGRPAGERWRTVRDAIADLPQPKDGHEHPHVRNHVGIPGARIYKGHSGSPLDLPAKSIKAGVHGCPGGEHILVRPDGSYRYLTVRECARIQGFPDHHEFVGPRSEAMRQIGNAVPVPLAKIVAERISTKLRANVHAIPTE